jgi:hypothetical protein
MADSATFLEHIQSIAEDAGNNPRFAERRLAIMLFREFQNSCQHMSGIEATDISTYCDILFQSKPLTSKAIKHIFDLAQNHGVESLEPYANLDFWKGLYNVELKEKFHHVMLIAREVCQHNPELIDYQHVLTNERESLFIPFLRSKSDDDARIEAERFDRWNAQNPYDVDRINYRSATSGEGDGGFSEEVRRREHGKE